MIQISKQRKVLLLMLTVLIGIGAWLLHSQYMNSATVINGVTVPPEPDPELNNATLAGIDVNGNGVRDDVERDIVLNYSNSKKRMAALFELAIGNRNSLLAADANDSTSAVAAIRRTDSAISCLHYIDPMNANSIENQLASIELNTEPRWNAYIKVQKILGGIGTTVPTDKKTLCTFDPDTLAN